MKLDGSIAPSINANRQMMELPANAIIATSVYIAARISPPCRLFSKFAGAAAHKADRGRSTVSWRVCEA